VVQVTLVASAAPGSDDATVDLAGLLIATTCLVLRTALATAETVELKDRSMTDGATGAFNMREFDVRLAERLVTQRRFGEGFALFAVDLDRFTSLNAASGPAVASAVLKRVVQAIRTAHPGVDIFRQAGDEFLVLAAASDIQEATFIGGALLDAIRSLKSEWASPSASIGFAMCPQHACEREELLRMASGARAWVKHHGRGRVMCYDERLVRPFGLEDRLRLIDERARRDMTRALSAATDARDPANARHSRNVAALATLLAEDCGFSKDQMQAIEVAAMLHDVGKIALPDPMLGGRTLSIRERLRSREHTELGERLLASVGIEGVAEWVRSHHERWDGEGYPDGLTGEEIPLAARIIALADAYDGMTMGVRYGAPMSKAAALQEIDLSLGTRFDPELGERFIALVGRTAALGWSDDWPTA
jgi:diguanylate cyclase (GGDEF)-like protein/putative nucleotidyltransferase with HDIG domain